MAEKDFLERIAGEKKEFIERCQVCGKCLTQCRIRPHASYADKDPAELQKARIDFLKGGEFSQEVYDTAFSCSGCHYCSEVCEQGLDPSRVGSLIRSELIERGHSAPPMYSFILPHERFSYFNIMSALLLDSSQTRWVDDVPEAPEHADVVYFPGCGMYVTPDRLFTGIDMLDRMGVDHVVLGGISHCCGSPSMGAGRSAEAAEYGAELAKSIAAFTPETAVTYCPGCTWQLRKGTASSGASFRPKHLSAFLAENLDRITFENPIEKTVTIHDPCHLGRGLGEFEGVRKVLEAIPGVTIAEMEHSRNNTLCCGSAASMTEPEASKAIGVGLLDEAKATGADILVAICNGCDNTFKKLGKDHPFEIVSFLTLVGRAMGIQYEDKMSQYMAWRDVDRVIEDARANIEASSYSEQEIRSFLEMFFSFA